MADAGRLACGGLLPVNDARGFIAWVGILFSAGVLGSVRFALIDLPALILVAAALWTAERARPRSAVGWLAAAALTRETSLGCLARALDRSLEIARCRFGRNLLRFLLAAAPLIAWLDLYPLARRSAQPRGKEFRMASRRLSGEMARMSRGGEPPDGSSTRLVHRVRHRRAHLAEPAFILARPRPADPWWRVGAAYVLLMLLPRYRRSGKDSQARSRGCCCRSTSPATCSRCAPARRSAGCSPAISPCSPGCWRCAMCRPPLMRTLILVTRNWDAVGVVQLGDGWYGRGTRCP